MRVLADEPDYEEDTEACAAARALSEHAVFSIRISKAQETGWPDRLFLIPGGRPLFVEFKRPGARRQRHERRQDLIHERLRYAGYEVVTCNSVEACLREVGTRCRTAQGGALADRATRRRTAA